MIKFFTYQFETRLYYGYKLLSEKSVFESFKKLEYQGFKILYSTSEVISYQIDSQIIRKLKLKRINNTANRIEERLYQLLYRSEENKEEEFNNYYWTYNCWKENSAAELSINRNNNFLEKRRRDKYCANKYKNRK